MKVSDALVEMLKMAGVEVIFGLCVWFVWRYQPSVL
jgi:hypothetical protein